MGVVREQTSFLNVISETYMKQYATFACICAFFLGEGLELSSDSAHEPFGKL